MARGGLEPPTPRFSVVRPDLSNGREIPVSKRHLAGEPAWMKARKFHRFGHSLGDEVRLISQCDDGTSAHRNATMPRLITDVEVRGDQHAAASASAW